MIVFAVMLLPHRMRERAIGLAVEQEFTGDACQLRLGGVGERIRVAFILEVDVLEFAGGFAAPESYIADLDNRPGRNAFIGEAAAAQDGGFERELRGQSGAHLRLGRRRAGLVVEDGVGAVAAALDAVGACRQRENPGAERDFELAANFAMHGGELRPPLALPAGEPARDALEARPPECLRLRVAFQTREALPAKRR